MLLRHAEAIVARLHAAQADLHALSAGSAGALRVGTYQSVGRHILPAVMRRFSAAWPRVELKLTEMSTDEELVALVERGDLDLTFADFRLWEGPFEEVHLFDDPYVLLVQSGTPLAQRRRPPSLEEIAELPLIGFRQCRSTQIVETQLATRGSGRVRLPLRRQRHRPGDGRRRRRGRARPAADRRPATTRHGRDRARRPRAAAPDLARLAPRPLPLARRARSPELARRSVPVGRLRLGSPPRRLPLALAQSIHACAGGP